MSCQELESIIHELVREENIDGPAQRSARIHAETCPRCASRLISERSLTAALRVVAADTENKTAPQRIETRLRTIFRQRFATQGAPALTSRSASRLRGWFWIPATATAGLLVLSVLAPRWLRSATPVQTGEERRAEPALPNPSETEPRTVISPASREPEIARRPLKARHITRRLQGVRQANPEQESAAARSDSEISTDFFPLTYGAEASLDSASLVRVKVPRSTLTSFGLPMDVDRASEPIKADLLIGNDGLARAIRFVREPRDSTAGPQIRLVGGRQ